MRGRKKMKEDKILAATKWVRIKVEINNRLQRATRKLNMKHAEFIRNAVIEKLEKEGF